MNKFWVGFRKLGLGFPKNRTAEKRERKRKKKNEENRFRSLLCKIVNRVGSNPTHSPMRVAVGSWSCWIRINPTPQRRSGDPDPSVLGFGPFTRRLLVLFSVSWIVLAMCTPMFAIWTSCVSWLLYKISKNCYAFLVYLWLFLWYFTCENWWKFGKC